MAELVTKNDRDKSTNYENGFQVLRHKSVLKIFELSG